MQDLYEIEKDPPGEGAGGVACCPARRYGGVLQAPPSGSGAEPQEPILVCCINTKHCK